MKSDEKPKGIELGALVSIITIASYLTVGVWQLASYDARIKILESNIADVKSDNIDQSREIKIIQGALQQRGYNLQYNSNPSRKHHSA